MLFQFLVDNGRQPLLALKPGEPLPANAKRRNSLNVVLFGGVAQRLLVRLSISSILQGIREILLIEPDLARQLAERQGVADILSLLGECRQHTPVVLIPLPCCLAN